MRFFEKFSKERYTPLYPFQKGIKGYNVFSLPVSFQDFAFEIQRALLRCFDWMQLPAFRQVNDILPGAAQYLRRLRCIDNSVRGKVPEILNSQRNAFAYPVEHRIRDGHVHIPCNAISARLHLHMLKIVRLLEKNLKCSCLFKMLLQIALLHYAIPEKYQQAMVLQRQHIFNSL